MLMPVAQELVVNAVKHASPTAIGVAVGEHDGELVLAIDDDGVGIDAGRPDRAVKAGHVGLAMVRRARRGRGRRAADRDPAPTAGPAPASTRPGLQSANGPGLNARGHSLDACSITSWTLPP